MIAFAEKVATKSMHGWANHACIVTRQGKPIAYGANRHIRHAEVAAISQIPMELRRSCVVWSFRFTKAGRRLAMAKPCKACEEFLIRSRIKYVMYSTADGQINQMRLR